MTYNEIKDFNIDELSYFTFKEISNMSKEDFIKELDTRKNNQ